MIWGFILQFAFGAIVLFAPTILEAVQLAIQKLLDFSNAGAELVFGTALVHGVAQTTTQQGGGAVVGWTQLGFLFAFTVLPTIIFISHADGDPVSHGHPDLRSCTGWRGSCSKTMGTSGAETL